MVVWAIALSCSQEGMPGSAGLRLPKVPQRPFGQSALLPNPWRPQPARSLVEQHCIGRCHSFPHLIYGKARRNVTNLRAAVIVRDEDPVGGRRLECGTVGDEHRDAVQGGFHRIPEPLQGEPRGGGFAQSEARPFLSGVV